MDRECARCGSNKFTKLSLIYAEGLSDLEARSRGWGLLFGKDGADFALGSFITKGELQTRLSRRVSPPRKWSYWKIVLGGLTGLMILVFILGYIDTFLRARANFDQQLAWFGYAWLCFIALILCVAARYNLALCPRRYRLWERSFMCRACGHIAQLPVGSGLPSQALGREP